MYYIYYGQSRPSLVIESFIHLGQTTTPKQASWIFFLAATGRYFDPAKPDGNCLFRTLSKQHCGNPEQHLHEPGQLTISQL